MSTATVAAVDLGASSGRVITARVGPGVLDLCETHRFVNRPVLAGGVLHWDILSLYADVLDGLRAASRSAGLDGVGIDSWGVDVGLLDADGALLGNPVHYRDARHQSGIAVVHAEIGPAELFAVNGLAHLPFNTVFQLAAIRDTARFASARQMLLIPDLFAYWLTGAVGAEVTNASTTGFIDATSRQWSETVTDRVGIPRDVLAPLREPGERLGELTPEVLAPRTAAALPLIAVGSHDTASAVVGVPAHGDRFAYISSGTWSLVGVELEKPVLSEAARAAGFTNEIGVDGTVRHLRNVMGLWLLQESLRTWAERGESADLDALLDEAARRPACAALVDPDDLRFLPPGDMPARIADLCRQTGQPVPADAPAVVRCILDSLALAYRRAVRAVVELTGRRVEVVHVVGGGARNRLLCQLTADACELPVLAGPVEATAVGNALVQARTLGAVSGGLPELRAVVRATQQIAHYVPSADGAFDRAVHQIG
jgi:rhamnulokinase